MLDKIKLSIEKNPKLKKAEIITLIILLAISLFSYIIGSGRINADPGNITYKGAVVMERDFDAEDYDEDSTMCDVIYSKKNKKVIVSLPYEEYLELDTERINAYEYETENGTLIWFDHADPLENAPRLIVLYDAASFLHVFEIALGDAAHQSHLLAGHLLARSFQQQ